MLGLCSCVISSAFFSIYFSSLRGESVTDFPCVPVLKHRTFPDVVSPDFFPRSRLLPSQRTDSAMHWPDWRAPWPRVYKSLVRCGLTIRSNGLPDRSRFQTIVRGRQPLNSGVRPVFVGCFASGFFDLYLFASRRVCHWLSRRASAPTSHNPGRRFARFFSQVAPFAVAADRFGEALARLARSVAPRFQNVWYAVA